MLLHRLKISGVLSFVPHGIDLPMERLNVLIGPNALGKSNLLEVLALLRAAPREIAEPVKRGGAVWKWLWKGDAAPDKACPRRLETAAGSPRRPSLRRHASIK
ncbi:MAG: AAA family ATPase [Spirochaetaceae bacterium]|nr:AAA family ATPase [Spirochaetaceae bacterium]